MVAYSFLDGSLGYTDTAGNKLVTSGDSSYFSGAAGTISAFRQLSGARGADGTTTWFSFMGYRLGTTTNATANIYPRAANVSLYTGPGTTERLATGNSSGAASNLWALIPQGSLGNIRTSTVSFAQITLAVLRIDHKAGNDDAYLFLNPTLGIEPSLSSAAAFSTNAFDFSFDNVRPFAGGVDTGNRRPYAELVVDEIRFGTTYADVTPFVGVPEPSVIALSVAGVALFGWRRKRRSS